MKDFFLLFFCPNITFASPSDSSVCYQLPVLIFIGIHIEDAFFATIRFTFYAICR
jgi:hypothetical protein